MTTLVLVRHGETEWNRVERFRGRADVPLNETGRAQAAATARRIRQVWTPSAVYTSPLSRALRTAEAIGAEVGLPVNPHPGLLDIDYGAWQGLTPDEVRQRWPEEARAWFERPQTALIPGGETFAQVCERGGHAAGELADRHDGKTIVLVGHTVVNRAIVLSLLGLSGDLFWRIRQDPCAVSVFDAQGGVFTLVTLNDTCHLPTGG